LRTPALRSHFSINQAIIDKQRPWTYVVRAFVQLREMLASNKELARRFAQLETRRDKKLTVHDETIAAVLSAIRQLMHPPVPKRRPIGFTADLGKKVSDSAEPAKFV
jgi:hypothetical protein